MQVAPPISYGPKPTYHYVLELDPARHELRGAGTIDVINDQAEPLREVVLRSWGSAKTFAIDGGRVRVDDITVDGAKSAAKQDGTVVRIPLAHPLARGEGVRIGLTLDAHAPDVTDRFGHDDRGNVMFGNVLPTLAVRDEDGWNTDPYMPWGESFYSLAADWDVSVRAPKDATVIASGVAASTTRGADGSVTQHIVAPRVRDFFVGAGHELRKLSADVDGAKVNVYTLANDGKAAADLLAGTRDSLRYFNQHLGRYDYPELDVFGVPQVLGEGMEYPNAILVDTKRPKGHVYSTAAHEVAHQWFYGMVGNNQYDDPWLDESLTTYATARFLHDVRGDAIEYSDAARELAKVGRDEHVTSPVSVVARGTHSDKSADPYLRMEYKVGPAVLETLRRKIGAAAFDDGLRGYFEANRGGVGTTQKLIDAMSASAGVDLTSWFAAHRIFVDEPASRDSLDPNGPAAKGASYGD